MLACNYLPHGYWWYVTGHVPRGKDPKAVDQKLTQVYGVRVSRSTRTRRKAAGQANIHYLRYEDFWVLLATKGEHSFYEREGGQIRNLREKPILFHGYSISVKAGEFLKKASPDAEPVRDGKFHARVQIARDKYAELMAYFRDIATRRTAEEIAASLFSLPFEPYAAIRKQTLKLLRIVNKDRVAAGLEELPTTSLRYHREPVSVFKQIKSAELASTQAASLTDERK